MLIASGEDILRAHPAVSRDFDDDYLVAYFGASAPAATATAFRAIRSVAPGEALSISATAEVAAPLRSEPLQEAFGWSDARVRSELAQRLEAAVEAASANADRLGLSLSSGLDSSAVASLLRAPVGALRPLAITYGCDHIPVLDERADGALLAQSCGLEHRALAADALGPLSTQATPVCADTPIANPYRALKTRVYGEFRAAGVDVVLTGNFGDHLVAEPGFWLVDALRARRLDLVVGSHVQLLARGGPRALWRDPGWRALLHPRVLRPMQAAPWLRPASMQLLRARQQDAAGARADWPHPRQTAHALGSYAAFDAAGECYFAQGHGIEVRHPYRDWPLVQMALSLAGHQSWRGGVGKFAVRAALRGRLPERWRVAPKHADMQALFEHGLAGRQERLRSLIERGRPWWSQHVQASAVDTALQTRDRQDCHALLIWLLAGFGMWLEIID